MSLKHAFCWGVRSSVRAVTIVIHCFNEDVKSPNQKHVGRLVLRRFPVMGRDGIKPNSNALSFYHRRVLGGLITMVLHASGYNWDVYVNGGMMMGGVCQKRENYWAITAIIWFLHEAIFWGAWHLHVVQQLIALLICSEGLKRHSPYVLLDSLSNSCFNLRSAPTCSVLQSGRSYLLDKST